MRLARLLTPLFALTLALPLASCGSSSDPTAPTTATVETTTFAPSLGIDLSAPGWTKTSTGLYYRTLVSAPSGAATVSNGQRVTVAYTGWLSNGTQFDSSTLPPFALGSGAVIAGWDQGILGMRVGEQRQLLIPPSLGYGDAGVYTGSAATSIPGNAVLVFNVQVLSAQ